MNIHSSKKYLVLLLLVAFFFTTSQGSESSTEPAPSLIKKTSACILPKRNLRPGEAPSGESYIRCTIAEQINYYRNVYDAALDLYGGNLQDLELQSIPGLSLILENMFALANKHLDQDSTRSKTDKAPYREWITKLWGHAAKLDGLLTNKNFLTLVKEIANGIQSYNENSTTYQNSSLYKSELFAPQAGPEKITFVICGHPNPDVKARNISPSHFVDQFFAESYSAYLAFLDVLSVKRPKSTKKDAHWSFYNGTQNMLTHDLIHNIQIYNSIENNQTGLKDKLKYIYDVRNKLRERGRMNESIILENGLFVIFHEFYGMPRMSIISDNFNKDLIENVKRRMIEPLINYGTDTYKGTARDREFLLKDKYFDQTEGKFKLVHDDQGPFLPITYDETLKKTTRPFRDIAPLREENPAKVEAREDLMIDALAEGYIRFWDCFLKILEENQE